MSKPDSTLVHNLETTGQWESYPSYRNILNRSNRSEVSAALTLYAYIADSDSAPQVTRYLECRTHAWFVRDPETGLVHVASNSCRLRWCPHCSRAKARCVTESVSDWAADRNDLRFLTLTIKHTSAPLESQLEFLYKKFRALRKHKQFKPYVRGGIWFFQLKYIEDSNQWHPHLHILLAGKFIPWDFLSKLWLHVTKTSSVVDIRAVKNAVKVAEYVARYVSRPLELHKIPFEKRVEAFHALHGKRFAGTWGVAKGVSLSNTKSKKKENYQFLGNWYTVLMSRKSDTNASSIFNAWQNKIPIPDGISVKHLEPSLNYDNFEDKLDVQVNEYVQGEFW